mmetsp:Transcript_111100/g.201945  ORF Transcript_111100/g.201945 Transcript_111100/m.201945 type:complete len:722 (+) Transcript_111100:83-2248(+)
MLFLVGATVLIAAAAEDPVLVTPIEKVVTLLEDLKTEVTTEATTAAANYDKFACWCKDTTKAKSDSIIGGADNIDTLSSTIADKTSTKVLKESELLQLKADKEKATKDLNDEVVLHQKRQAEYDKAHADVSKALSSLDGAIGAMKAKKQAIDDYSFAQVRSSVSYSLALADALGLVSAPKRKAISSLLQQKVDPNDATYKYHSSEIVSLLEELKTQFTGEKTELETEWGKTDTASKALQASLSSTISTKTTEIGTTSNAIDTLTGEIAGAKGDLVNAQSLLKDDQLYLKDMTAQCETTSKDWDQQSKMRADEITALTEAITILKDKVTPADVVNVRAVATSLLEGKGSQVKAASKVLQAAKLHSANAPAPVAKSSALSFVQTQRSHTFLEARRMKAEERTDRAVAMLQDAGRQLKSPVLSALAMQIAADPFKKVKELIEKLIQRLVAESTSEATKKGYCDTEVSKATEARNYRMADVSRLSLEAGDLEVKIDALTQELTVLNTKIPAMQGAMEEAVRLRGEEKTTNLATIQTAQEGLTALKEAISVLKEFYKKAGKAALLQEAASPIEEDLANKTIEEGPYKGKQEGSVAIISLLEQIKDDFERTILTTTTDEKTAAAEHVELIRQQKSTIKGWETKKELNEQDKDKAEKDLAATMSEMNDNMKLLDTSLKTLETLKPMCIDSGMTYAERVAKREEEIAALNKALCILDTEGVETDCPPSP